MTSPEPQWNENDSHLYQKIAEVAVPARASQLATLLTLIPFGVNDQFHAVEIGSGEGILSAALLTCFPNATVIALDGSSEMRKQTHRRLKKFTSRGSVKSFNLAASNWYATLNNADCVLSSLCLHHLSGTEKQALFATIYNRLSPFGALLIADLVKPQRVEAQSLFAATWDYATHKQSIEQTGSTKPFEMFKQTEWNLYRYPDPVDKPSPLFHQLGWLKVAGFAVVDCYWMQAGHAIYGGYKTSATALHPPLLFKAALKTAQLMLKTQ